MNSAKQTKASVIHTESGNAYEVINSLVEIERLMLDDFIQDSTFLRLRFPDGCDLYLRKKDIESFYIGK